MDVCSVLDRERFLSVSEVHRRFIETVEPVHPRTIRRFLETLVEVGLVRRIKSPDSVPVKFSFKYKLVGRFGLPWE